MIFTAISRLKRWVRSTTLRSYEWQHSKSYWRLRQNVQKFQFSIRKRIFALRFNWNEARSSASIAKEFISLVSSQALLAALVVATVELTERFFMSLSGPLQQHLPYLFLIDLNQGLYTSLLGILMQTDGVFLGLYFATLSVVASTAYARVPSDVRALIVDDKIGNLYLRIVAFTAAATTYLLAAASLGWKPGVISLYLTLFLAVLSILSFRALGVRAFHFFDPTTLSKNLNSELIRWVTEATSSGFNWLDQSFQNHYRNRAENALRTYKNIISLSGQKENAASRALLDTVHSLLVFLSWYALQKLHIPSNSYWFRRKLVHVDWFKAGHTKTEIALNSGVIAEPDQVPDHSWVEKDVTALLHQSFKSLREQNDHAAIATLASKTTQTIRQLIEAFAISEAASMAQVLREVARAHASRMPHANSIQEDDRRRLLFELEIIDNLGLSLIELSIGLRKSLDQLSVESISQIALSLHRGRSFEAYKLAIPRHAIERAEQLAKGLTFERAVEKYPITPIWLLAQELAMTVVRFSGEAIDSTLAEAEKTFVRELESWIADKKYLAACQLVLRGIEFCNKFDALISSSQQWQDSISLLNKQSKKSWPFPEFEKCTRSRVRG